MASPNLPAEMSSFQSNLLKGVVCFVVVGGVFMKSRRWNALRYRLDPTEARELEKRHVTLQNRIRRGGEVAVSRKPL